MDLLQTSKQNSLSLPKRLSALGLFLILPFFTMGQFAFEGPIPKITQGFGAFGNNAFTSEFFQLTPDSTYECSDTLRCIITYPTGLNSTRGTVFRFPGSSNTNMTDSNYWNESKLDREFVASLGYVSVTMQYNNANEYGCAYYLLDEAVRLYSNLIDTTRVGFHGISQGAAVTNWLSLKKYTNDGWGSNGRFAWPDAGASFIGWLDNWPQDIDVQSDSGLAAMPDDVLYLMTLSDWDQVPDPRTLIDMYNFMGVPDSNKEFMIIRGDTVNSYIYWATHFTLNSYENDSNQFNVYVTKHDALDYWMGTRLLHSLMEAAWNNDKTARRICMGNGDTLQTTIAGGQMRGPIVTDTPWMSMLHSWNSGLGFMGDCEAPWNMRQYVTADACFILDIPEVSAQTEVKMYPNPAQTNRQITFESSERIISIVVFDLLGRIQQSTTDSSLTLGYSGNYVLGITFDSGRKTALRLTVID